MPSSVLKNLHTPLPEALYQQLRAEAQRTRRPATALAREAIECWFAEKRRAALHQEISAYACEVAGTEDDHDTGLEAASVEHLLSFEKKARKNKKT